MGPCKLVAWASSCQVSSGRGRVSKSVAAARVGVTCARWRKRGNGVHSRNAWMSRRARTHVRVGSSSVSASAAHRGRCQAPWRRDTSVCLRHVRIRLVGPTCSDWSLRFLHSRSSCNLLRSLPMQDVLPPHVPVLLATFLAAVELVSWAPGTPCSLCRPR